MKNLNSKLLKKSFDLKKSNIYGGKAAECTQVISASCHTQDGCTDTIYETRSDENVFISTCTEYDCPDAV